MARLVRITLPFPRTLPLTLKVCVHFVQTNFMYDLKLTIVPVVVEGKKVIQTVTIDGEVVSKQSDSKGPLRLYPHEYPR